MRDPQYRLVAPGSLPCFPVWDRASQRAEVDGVDIDDWASEHVGPMEPEESMESSESLGSTARHVHYELQTLLFTDTIHAV